MVNPTSTGPEDGESDRKEVLNVLADQIRTVNARIEASDPDPDDLEAQRMQVKWTRTLGYLAGQYRKLAKDIDIDDLEENMELMQTVVDMEDNG